MRTGGSLRLRLQQRNPARHAARNQIQFGDVRRIPQAAPGTPAIAASNHGVRERGRDHLVSAEVELLQNAPVGRVEQHGIVGKVVGHEQLVASRPWDHGDASGIRDRCSCSRFADSEGHLLPGSNCLWGNFYEALRAYLAIFELIDRDTVASVARLRAGGIRDRPD